MENTQYTGQPINPGQPKSGVPGWLIFLLIFVFVILPVTVIGGIGFFMYYVFDATMEYITGHPDLTPMMDEAEYSNFANLHMAAFAVDETGKLSTFTIDRADCESVEEIIINKTGTNVDICSADSVMVNTAGYPQSNIWNERMDIFSSKDEAKEYAHVDMRNESLGTMYSIELRSLNDNIKDSAVTVKIRD